MVGAASRASANAASPKAATRPTSGGVGLPVAGALSEVASTSPTVVRPKSRQVASVTPRTPNGGYGAAQETAAEAARLIRSAEATLQARARIAPVLGGRLSLIVAAPVARCTGIERTSAVLMATASATAARLKIAAPSKKWGVKQQLVRVG